ncbi:MAG TPA: LysR family transcriptional regulator [Albitalea sp.]|uniref:LysR family transcriptional regulator n=1 Tax=Piscinibacter sp. TaxID=1903157 RepID=UPI002ED1387A
MLDLNDIALFVQVVKAGSFAEAARRAGMPPNTASRRIQELEVQLGLRLLHRSTRRLTLTDAGEALYARCADQVDALSSAVMDLASDSESPSGKVRVAAPADFFNWFEMDWINEFFAAHPRVRLEFVLSDARADLIGEGIDLAIRAGKVLEPTLVAKRIGTSRWLLVASPSYLAARGTPAKLDELAAHDCIAMLPSAGRAVWRLDSPDGPAEVVVAGRFHANSAQVLVKAALAGLGIALLPEVMATPLLRENRLAQVLPGFGVEGVDLYLVYLSRRQQPRAVSAFAEFAVGKLLDQGLVRAAVNDGLRDRRSGRLPDGTDQESS